MRTIKFRGKSLNNGEMVFGDLIHGQGSKSGKMYILPQTRYYPAGCNNLDGWEVIPDTVGQFTGLLDKDGKEIYEGDILLVDEFWDGEAGMVKIHNEVGIKDGCFGYIGENTGDLIPFYDSKVTERIVGNIHDNPELLKGEEQ